MNRLTKIPITMAFECSGRSQEEILFRNGKKFHFLILEQVKSTQTLV